MEIELTLVERLLLTNQYNILSIIDSDNKEYYEKNINILKNGYVSDFDNMINDFSEEISIEESRVIYGILLFYSTLEDKLNEFTDEQVREIKNMSWGEFKGFDHNNENKYYLFLMNIFSDPEKYESLQKYQKNFNSVGQHYPVYKRIVERWNNAVTTGLTYNEIIDILKAGKTMADK